MVRHLFLEDQDSFRKQLHQAYPIKNRNNLIRIKTSSFYQQALNIGKLITKDHLMINYNKINHRDLNGLFINHLIKFIRKKYKNINYAYTNKNKKVRLVLQNIKNNMVN